MPRRYRTGFSNVAVTAGQDLIEIQSPADAITRVLKAILSQSTELGDAAEEQLRLQWKRGVGSVTSGSGGSTATPQPIEDGDAAYGGTVEVNNTTRMAVGSGSIEMFPEFSWNIRQNYVEIYLPEDLDIISPSNRLALDLLAAPADSITMSLLVVLEEVGG